MKKEAKSIEEIFDELELLLEKLESGESSLEESFALYEAGMKMVKTCNTKIDRVEKKILVLNQEGEDDEYR